MKKSDGTAGSRQRTGKNEDAARSQSTLTAGESPKRTTAPSATAPLCRFYFLQGSCRFGEHCSYSHALPDNMTCEEARGQIPCPYFAKGCCRYGDYCQLRHDPNDLLVPKTMGASAECDSTNAVCGICLEDVKQVGHKFGLLSCCRHVFCFECLMEWRKEGSEEAEDRRSCPACRKKSDWVIPSDIMATSEEEKDRISTQYRAKLGRIPCKRFDGKLGSCPYGSDCFYAHLSAETGLDCKQADRSMKQLYEQRRRHRSQQRRLEDDIDMISRAMLLMDLYAYRGLGYNFDYYDSDFDSDDDAAYPYNDFF
ncbi:hypothetical protein ACA910_013632 [Epithemia clementina (nom. ined.)]